MALDRLQIDYTQGIIRGDKGISGKEGAHMFCFRECFGYVRRTWPRYEGIWGETLWE